MLKEEIIAILGEKKAANAQKLANVFSSEGIDISTLGGLIKSLSDFDKIIIFEVMKLLDNRAALEYLRKGLQERSWHVRNKAAEAIAAILGASAIPELAPLLQDKALGVREDVKKLIMRLEGRPQNHLE